MNREFKICLILHNLRSAHNVGAIFRTAEAAGVAKLYLTGYTPAPRDRFGRTNRELSKTALGAEEYLAWSKVASLNRLLLRLKREGVQLLALEQAEGSLDYRKVKIKKPFAVIVGNEVRGLSPSVLKHCDIVVELPMRGRKESLNVAVAAGIFLYYLLP